MLAHLIWCVLQDLTNPWSPTLLNTVMCLSIGAPKNNKFSIWNKWKIYYFRCPKIWAHYSLIIMCLNIGTPKNHHFSFGTNGKVVVLGVPILKHFRVDAVLSNVLISSSQWQCCKMVSKWQMNHQLDYDRIYYSHIWMIQSVMRSSLMVVLEKNR